MGLYKKINYDHDSKSQISNEQLNPVRYTEHLDTQDSADSVLNSDLQTALNNSSFLFAGTIFDAILGLICTILIARFYSVGDYGIYSLTVFLVVFVYSLAGNGIHEANSRYIAYYRGKNDTGKIWGVVKTSFILVITSSLLFTIGLYLLSDVIAISVFNMPELAIMFRIFILSIPFWTITSFIISTFRGYESVKPKVYFTFLSVQILKVLFFVYVIINRLSLAFVFWGFLAAVVITFCISSVYFYQVFYKKLSITTSSPWYFHKIFSFAWPLLFSGLAWFLISGLDKIMLGILTTEREVGYYNAATPIARYLIFFYTAIVFVFQPIASRLYAQDKTDELKTNYQVLTKWLLTVAFPFILVLLLFPETVISIFYGGKYVIASTALQLMTIGIMVFLILSLSREVLAIYGKTRIIFYFTAVGAFLNIILNLFFIPMYGISGAALATMITFIFINGMIGYYCYRETGIHPFRRNFLVPLGLSFTLLAILYSLVMYFELQSLPLYGKIIISILLSLSYFVIIIKTKSYDKEDIQLFYYVEKKIGFKLGFLRKIISRLL
jgi:O-antigen/teichoic acid export membrane protein